MHHDDYLVLLRTHSQGLTEVLDYLDPRDLPQAQLDALEQLVSRLAAFVRLGNGT